MKTTMTPTPWSIGEEHETMMRIVAGNALIAIVKPLYLMDFEGMEANARAIVHRVNVHDQLVAALKDAITVIIGLAGQQAMMDDFYEPFMDEIRDALAAATTQEQ